MHRTLLVFLLCAVAKIATASDATGIELFDASRQRPIPVVVFAPPPDVCESSCPVVLFGTGYRAVPGDYSFLLEGLANAGFAAIAIQHDIESDAPMPNTGNVREDRGAHWQRGVRTIAYAIENLAARLPRYDWSSVVLAGHSQGGDIAALSAARTSRPVRSLVTLDNRRVALPDTTAFPILTLRSADQPADPGVLPDTGSSRAQTVCVVRLKDTIHDDMNDGATPRARAAMLQTVLSFLLHGRCMDAQSSSPGGAFGSAHPTRN